MERQLAARAGRARALLETLRAPLLLSPVADVLAGAAVAMALVQGAAPGAGGAATAGPAALPERLVTWGEVLPGLLLAAAAGVCLLAAGMAQNALVDLDEDRARKPQRPLPRGAVTPGAVRATQRACTVAALVLAALVSRAALGAAAAILLASWLYHHALKRRRVAGCLALGTARALDLSLGLLAVGAAVARDGPLSALLPASAPATGGDLRLAALHPVVLAAPLAYGLYITGTALHASTDDEPGAPAPASRVGLSTCCAVLLLAAAILAVTAAGAGGDGRTPALAARALLAAGVITLLLAAARLVVAWRTRPAPAITGAALSNLYLFDAALCFAGLAALPALVVLGLFGLSRRLLTTFPPS